MEQQNKEGFQSSNNPSTAERNSESPYQGHFLPVQDIIHRPDGMTVHYEGGTAVDFTFRDQRLTLQVQSTSRQEAE